MALASQFAPSIIKYFTNSDTAGEVAQQVIGIAKIVTGKESPDESIASIKANPEMAAQFKAVVMLRDADLEKAYLADRQDARERDVKLADAGRTNYRANALAGVAVLLVIMCLMIVVWGSGMDEFAKGMVTLICGRALGWVEQIFSFEYGTTRASKVKDATISNLSKQ